SLINLVKVEPVHEFIDKGALKQGILPWVRGIQPLSGSVGRYTFGLVVNLKGQRGFLTNSHCTNTQGGIEATPGFQTKNNNADLIGTETVDPPYFTEASNSECPGDQKCRYSDSAFYAIPNVTVTAKRGV